MQTLSVPTVLPTHGLPNFRAGNSKLPDSTLTFALPSGHTCPGARACLARADRHSGTLTLGPDTVFCCYEASIEKLRPSVRTSRWRNFDLIKSLSSSEMADLLALGIAARRDFKTTHVRWFTGGDLFSLALRDAIFQVCDRTPDLIHYFYTKNLPLLITTGQELIDLPDNLRVTASWGGRFDFLLEAGVFPRTARVVNTRAEALALGLPIDTTDRYAWQSEAVHFCHLSHGWQPPGSVAREAINARRRQKDFTGYGARRHAA